MKHLIAAGLLLCAVLVWGQTAAEMERVLRSFVVMQQGALHLSDNKPRPIGFKKIGIIGEQDGF
jgi:hypothetical protein